MITPLENVASADLFDEIVAAIDGNGWDIEYDGRNSGDGPFTVYPWPEGHQNLGSTLGNEGANTYCRMPRFIRKENGLTRVTYFRSNATGGHNPVLKGFPGYSSVTDIAANPSSNSNAFRFAYTPVTMFNGKYWALHAGYRWGTSNAPWDFEFNCDLTTPLLDTFVKHTAVLTSSNFDTDKTGVVTEMTSSSASPTYPYHELVHVIDPNTVLLFSPANATGNTTTGERIVTTELTITTTDPTAQAAEIVSTAVVREFLNLADMPPECSIIRTITGVVEETDRYVLYVLYTDTSLGRINTLRMFVTNKDLINPVFELDTAPVFNNDYYYVAPVGNTDNEFYALSGTGLAAPETVFFIRQKPTTAGFPDTKGLFYESVVFKNSSNHRFVLMQLDPLQVSPPSTAPITTNKPIFVRPLVFDKNETLESLAQFKFDPVRTGHADTIAPALYTDLTPGTPQTFTGWVSVDEDGFYVHTESSDTSEVQVMGASLTKPLIGSNPNAAYYDVPFNLICYSAGKAGVIDAVGTSFNGYTVTLEPRGTGTGAYLPRAHMVSYSSALTQESETDNKVYGFPVYWVHNPADYGDPAVASDSFFFGEDTRLRFISEGAGVTQGEEVFTTYKASLIPTAVDDNDPVVLKRLAVKQ